jgi:predicted RNase H-like HicB family nuclease
MKKCEIIIKWSDEDQAFLADVSEFPGCVAHGDMHESALANFNQPWIYGLKRRKSLMIPSRRLKVVVLPLHKHSPNQANAANAKKRAAD